MKKLLSLLSLLIVTSMILTACGGGAPAPATTPTLVKVPPTSTEIPATATSEATDTPTEAPTLMADPTVEITATTTPFRFTLFDATPVAGDYTPSIMGMSLGMCNINDQMLLVIIDADGNLTGFACTPFIHVSPTSINIEMNSNPGQPLDITSMTKMGGDWSSYKFAFILRMPDSQSSWYAIGGRIDDSCSFQFRNADGVIETYANFKLGNNDTRSVKGLWLMAECVNTGGPAEVKIGLHAINAEIEFK